ncbi:uncharacterized protein GIQ15_01627 [Arthroderma uncinatum]|uniref:uncharacterized protein n=1 Tax=Arthroderma uncinatum TaxID=74035 RepID=UPI00144AF26F|nr:uncharacterized protein GIQ15_01627 [Arthroderma uncinatum]KAF3492110.1 hypothetical protein GIQ15_01627 [Arthroderma uncinatum]
MISDNVLQPDSSFSPTIDRNLSVPEALNSPLFVPSASDLPTQPESLGRERSPDGSSDSSAISEFADEDLQPADGSSVTIGLPTPPSDPPSPAEQISKRTTHRNSKSKQCKIVKATVSRDKLGQKKLLTKRSLVEKQPRPAPEEPRISNDPSPARNALCELSDPDLQQTLEAGEGLIRDGLSEHQDSCMWREKGFWSEDALCLSILANSSAEERFCQVFRYVNTQLTRSLDQKLRLRISHALLYLSFESLTQEKRSGMRSGRQENPDQHRAATFSADYLLERSYPDWWGSMDVRMKRTLRRQLHEQKRQGSRCWRMASVLGLGALLACGDTLTKVIKNHGRYPLPKFDAVINYVANAYPGVVCLYHEFDALVKQILLGETLTAKPTRQTVDDGICQAAAIKLTLRQVEENWQQIDLTSASLKLIKECEFA